MKGNKFFKFLGGIIGFLIFISIFLGLIALIKFLIMSII